MDVGWSTKYSRVHVGYGHPLMNVEEDHSRPYVSEDFSGMVRFVWLQKNSGHSKPMYIAVVGIA